MSTILRLNVCLLFALTVVLSNADAHALDKELIDKGVRYQDQFCHQLDEQIAQLENLLDRVKGAIPKDLKGYVASYQAQAKSQKKSSWRVVVRDKISELKQKRDDVAENKTVVIPALRVSTANVGDFGMIDSGKVIIQKESGPTRFYGLTQRGASFETIIAVGWKHAGLKKEMVVPPRDTVKYGSGASGVEVVDIREFQRSIQNSLNAANSGPKKAQVVLSGGAVITQTISVTNAWGTAIDGSAECKVVELMFTEDEMIQAIMAARNAAKKNDEKN